MRRSNCGGAVEREAYATAVHETGHSVANVEYGFRFGRALLYPDGGGEVEIAQGYAPSSVSEAEAWVVALFAGYAAENVILNEPLTVEGEDWQQCWNKIRPLFRTEHRFEAFT